MFCQFSYLMVETCELFNQSSVLLNEFQNYYFRDLTVKSRARVALKPRMSRPPFFGGIQFCFLDDVAIDFDLDGLADICDWSPIRRKIRKAVVKDAGEAIVYPNKVFIPTSK